MTAIGYGCGHSVRNNPDDPDAASGSRPTATPFQGAFNWSSAGSLPNPLQGHRAFASGGYVYVLGGTDNLFTFRSDVWSAPLGPGAAIGPFTATAALPIAVFSHAAAVAGTSVEVMGGISNVGGPIAVTDARYGATLLGAGAVSAWTSLAPLANAVRQLDAASAQGFVFAAGGNDVFPTPTPGGAADTVRVAPLGSGPWTTTTPMPKQMTEFELLSYNSNLIAVGGTSPSSGTLSDVSVAAVSPSGTIASWISTLPLPVPLRDSAVTLHGNRIVVAGGILATTAFSPAVYVGALNTDGTVSSWKRVTDLPNALTASQAISDGTTVWILGGVKGSTASPVITNEIWSAPVQ